MSKAAHDHRVATILHCISQGMTPAETAYVFRKQAEAIHAYCDELTARQQRQKTATISAMLAGLFVPKTTAAIAATALAAPALVSYGVGNQLGRSSADILVPSNETDVPTIQKAEEILRMKQETANILARVEQRKKEQAEKSKSRSVRALY